MCLLYIWYSLKLIFIQCGTLISIYKCYKEEIVDNYFKITNPV